MPVQDEQRLEPQGNSPTTAPVPVPMQPAERSPSQAGSLTEDAPLSVSPGTLRVASMSLVTPPSELVTSDMLGAARGAAGAEASAEVSSSSGLGPATDSRASNVLGAVARGAAAQRGRDHRGSQHDSRPAADSGGLQTQPSLSTVPCSADVTAHGAACQAATACTHSDQAAAEHQPLNARSPAEPRTDAAPVDAGLLSNILRAGPHASMEQVSTIAVSKTHGDPKASSTA